MTKAPSATRGIDLGKNTSISKFCSPRARLVASVGDASTFAKGRNLAVWLGWTPHHSREMAN